jgi:hypothetical protein
LATAMGYSSWRASQGLAAEFEYAGERDE